MSSYTRAELYELVWSESRLSLAKKLGVSDVWIRKACVKADIPVPPPGYWARAAAGKRSQRPALPVRGLGKAEHITLGGDRYFYAPVADPIEISAVPVYTDTIDGLRLRAQLDLGRIAVPRGFDRVDPSIEKLLKEDEERRLAAAKERYYWKKPRFDCPAATRRLKIVNALLVMLAKAGCHGVVGREDLTTCLTVGDTRLTLRLSAKGARPPRPGYPVTLELTNEQREPLVLEVEHVDALAALPHQWSDSPEKTLEQQLPAIAVELLIHGEMAYRDGVARRRQWLIDEKHRREQEALRARAEAERREAERVARLEKARRDHLLQLAEQLRQSDDIRCLVAAINEKRQDDGAVSEWTTWALALADRLDPRLLPLERLMASEATGNGP